MVKMFFVCCGRQKENTSETCTEPTGLSFQSNQLNDNELAKTQYSETEKPVEMHRMRTISTSSFSSIKSSQSFYSVQSTDSDTGFYSVHSDSSNWQRY
ncbi:hypothetical protein HUJ04_005066 [Dendroctonus ponderosae]